MLNKLLTCGAIVGALMLSHSHTLTDNTEKYSTITHDQMQAIDQHTLESVQSGQELTRKNLKVGKWYKVTFENDDIKTLTIILPGHEKS